MEKQNEHRLQLAVRFTTIVFASALWKQQGHRPRGDALLSARQSVGVIKQITACQNLISMSLFCGLIILVCHLEMLLKFNNYSWNVIKYSKYVQVKSDWFAFYPLEFCYFFHVTVVDFSASHDMCLLKIITLWFLFLLYKIRQKFEDKFINHFLSPKACAFQLYQVVQEKITPTSLMLRILKYFKYVFKCILYVFKLLTELFPTRLLGTDKWKSGYLTTVSELLLLSRKLQGYNSFLSH